MQESQEMRVLSLGWEDPLGEGMTTHPSILVMLKPSMQDLKHDLTIMGDECNCPMVSTFFGITLLGDWDED